MPTLTLHFENARLAQQIFNNTPRNLQLLQEKLNVKAVSRDGWIQLDGEEGAIDQAKQMIESLEASIRSGAPIRNRDFADALKTVEASGADTLK